MRYIFPLLSFSTRPLFNWAHWLLGNAAWLCGLVAVFLAGELGAAAFIPTRDWYWAVLVFAVVHVIFHAVLTLQREWAKRKQKVTREGPQTHTHTHTHKAI